MAGGKMTMPVAKEGSGHASRVPAWLSITAGIGLLSAVKLWLVRGQGLTGVPGNVYDDELFLSLARSIMRGEWLGPYSHPTLFKGPFYPLWLALVSRLGIPLLLAEHLIYLAACGLTVAALRPLCGRVAFQILLFALLAFNPVTWAAGVGTQVMREGIFPALALGTAAFGVGLALRAAKRDARRMLWAAGLGLSLAALWLTREEGLWVAPLLLVLGAMGIVIIRSRATDRLTAALILVFPLALAVALVGGTAFLNRAFYGVFVVTEVTSSPFTDAYRALLRIRQDDWKPTIPVSRDALRKAYDVSAAAAELKPHMEMEVAPRWSRQMQGVREAAARDPLVAAKLEEFFARDLSGIWRKAVLQDDEIHGPWFIWALREAAAAAGHHRSAPEAAAFYRRLAAEINDACGSNRLGCDPPGVFLMPRWRRAHLQPFVMSMLGNMLFLGRFSGITSIPDNSVGDAAGLTRVKEMTRERLMPSQFTVAGRVEGHSAPVTISVRNGGGSVLASSEIVPGADGAAQPFRLTGPMTGAGGIFNEFSELFVHGRDGTVVRMSLDGTVKARHGRDIHLFVEQGGPLEDLTSLDRFRLRVLEGISSLYQALVLPAIALLVLGALFRTVFRPARNASAVRWIVGALAASIAARLVLLAAVHVTAFPTTLDARYFSSLHGLLIVAIVVAGTAIFMPGMLTEEARGVPCREECSL